MREPILRLASVMLWVSYSSIVQAQPSGFYEGPGFYSFDILHRLADALRVARVKGGAKDRMCRINDALIDTQNKRLVFVDSLRTFAAAREANASFLEVDLKLNDVGNSAAHLIRSLEALDFSLGAVEAELPQNVAHEIRAYWQRRSTLVGRDILRDHQLTADIPTLKLVIRRVDENSGLLAMAALDLRLFIREKYPNCNLE